MLLFVRFFLATMHSCTPGQGAAGRLENQLAAFGASRALSPEGRFAVRRPACVVQIGVGCACSRRQAPINRYIRLFLLASRHSGFYHIFIQMEQ